MTTAIYVILIGILAALFILATWWRYAAPIPPWYDDESKGDRPRPHRRGV